MLEQEEAVDGKIDNFSERLAASLHRAEKLQQEGDFFTRKVYSEVEEIADEWSNMHNIEVILDILLSVIVHPSIYTT